VSNTKKFSTGTKSIDLVYAEYGHALRVRAEDKTGAAFRNIIQKSVPKHMRQDVMTLVEESRKPPNSQTREIAFHMLQQIAVANQIGGRREFSSKDVVLSLAQHTEELIQWLSLEADKDRGVMMIKTCGPLINLLAPPSRAILVGSVCSNQSRMLMPFLF
jgi:hypothetical protein